MRASPDLRAVLLVVAVLGAREGRAAPDALVVLRPGAVAFTSSTSTVRAFVVGDRPATFARVADEAGRVRVRSADLDDVVTCFPAPSDLADVEVDAWVEPAALARVSATAAAGTLRGVDVVVHPGALLDVDSTTARTPFGDVALVGAPLASTTFRPDARDASLSALMVHAAALPRGFPWPASITVQARRGDIDVVPLAAARADGDRLRFVESCVEATLQRKGGFTDRETSALRSFGMTGLLGAPAAQLAVDAPLLWQDGAPAGRVRHAHAAPRDAAGDGAPALACAPYAMADALVDFGGLGTFGHGAGTGLGTLGRGAGTGSRHGPGGKRGARSVDRPAAPPPPARAWSAPPTLCVRRDAAR